MNAKTLCGAAISPRLAYACAFLACGVTAAGAQELVVEELWRMNGDAQAVLFASIDDIAEATSGAIWVTDPRNSMVLSIDTTHAVHVIAREGKGPGEVTGPARIARTPSGNMAVYDINALNIQVFNPDGQFERRVPLELRVGNPKGFAVLPDGDFVLSGGIPGGAAAPGGEHGIHVFGQDGELKSSWWPIPHTRNPRAGMYVAGGPVDVLPDGSILFSNAAPHRIMRFSADGGERELIASDPELLESPGDKFIQVTGSGASRRVTFDWYFPQSRLVRIMPSGNILNVVEFRDRGETLFQLYKPSGSNLVHTWMDTAYNALSLTSNGDVLAEWVDPVTGESYVVRLKVGYNP